MLTCHDPKRMTVCFSLAVLTTLCASPAMAQGQPDFDFQTTVTLGDSAPTLRVTRTDGAGTTTVTVVDTGDTLSLPIKVNEVIPAGDVLPEPVRVEAFTAITGRDGLLVQTTGRSESRRHGQGTVIVTTGCEINDAQYVNTIQHKDWTLERHPLQTFGLPDFEFRRHLPARKFPIIDTEPSEGRFTLERAQLVKDTPDNTGRVFFDLPSSPDSAEQDIFHPFSQGGVLRMQIADILNLDEGFLTYIFCRGHVAAAPKPGGDGLTTEDRLLIGTVTWGQLTSAFIPPMAADTRIDRNGKIIAHHINFEFPQTSFSSALLGQVSDPGLDEARKNWVDAFHRTLEPVVGEPITK